MLRVCRPEKICLGNSARKEGWKKRKRNEVKMNIGCGTELADRSLPTPEDPGSIPAMSNY